MMEETNQFFAQRVSKEFSWPPTTYGDKIWDSQDNDDAGYTNNRQPTGHYHPNEMPLIASHSFAIPAEIIAVAENALTSILEFDSVHGSTISPFAQIMLRTEAIASSEIEHLSASTRTILQAEIGVKSGANAEMIAANTEAMIAAIEGSSDISVTSILTMHQVLMAKQKVAPAGVFRDGPVWVGGSTPVTASMVGVDPEGVVSAVEDLVAFANRHDVPEFIKIAITHAHFENIHPFDDGNGRTGRTLMHAMLRRSGLTKTTVVPISAGLLTEPHSYYSALTQYRDGDAAPIVLLLSDSVAKAIANARALAEEINLINVRWGVFFEGVRKDATIWKVINHLNGTPLFTARSLQLATSISTSAMYDAIALLERYEIVIKSGSGERAQWRSPELLQALQGFAHRAGFRVEGAK